MLSKRSYPIEPGDINCRYYGRTYDDVNRYTSYQLAQKYEITIEHFFVLNPGLRRDCPDMLPNVYYCVAGCKFISVV
jgi:hypothetical protein